MNHMKQVAHILGLEIGEEFFIKGCIDDFRFKFTEEDVGYFYDGTWVSILCFLGNLLNGKWELVKIPKSLLTAKEKEYLAAVIKPFREEFRHIVKYKEEEYEYLVIYLNYDFINLPVFKIGSRYKGLEIDKGYTLKELDL